MWKLVLVGIMLVIVAIFIIDVQPEFAIVLGPTGMFTACAGAVLRDLGDSDFTIG